MGATRKSKQDLAEEIVGRLARRHSTAVVLFHHAVAERLGLGPTDHKCLDLLRERGATTGSELASITGLTTGAITGVVARLEHLDMYGASRIHAEPLRKDVAALLENLDTRQLTAIAEFLTQSTDLIYRHAALLRAHNLYAPHSADAHQPLIRTQEMKIQP